METKSGVQEMDAGGEGCDKGRRRAMRKIAAGVGALAGLSVIPEQWTRPFIGRIVIPAHALTSGEVEEPEVQPPQPQGCGLGAGCYYIISPAFSNPYINWPGEIGPHLVPAHASAACADTSNPVYRMVIATNPAEAAEMMVINEANVVPLTVSEVRSGCSLYLAMVG